MPYKHLTEKQELFCLKYYELGNASEAARLAGYSLKNVGFHTGQVLNSPLVKARLNELRQMEENTRQQLELESVMSVLERKQKLSEVGRVDVTEFVNEEGEIDLSGGNTCVIAEIIVKDWRGGKGGRPSSRTKAVKLHSKLQAIQELNKMDGIYTEGPQVHIDNRKIEISVVSERAKELTEGIVRGDRT